MNASSPCDAFRRTPFLRNGAHPKSQATGPSACLAHRPKSKVSWCRAIRPFRSSKRASITLCTGLPVPVKVYQASQCGAVTRLKSAVQGVDRVCVRMHRLPLGGVGHEQCVQMAGRAVRPDSGGFHDEPGAA
jgi:hypothetical protein